MKILGPTRFHRLNEAGGLVFLFAGLFLILCLISYHPQDPSWNSVTGADAAHNLTGLAGSYIADLLFPIAGPQRLQPAACCCGCWPGNGSARRRFEAATVKVFGSRAAVLEHLHRALHPALLAALERSILGRRRDRHFDRRFAGVDAEPDWERCCSPAICLILSLYLISRFSMAHRRARGSPGRSALLGAASTRVWPAWREQRRMALARERAEQRADAEQKAVAAARACRPE